jgi:hypothetical protein
MTSWRRLPLRRGGVSTHSAMNPRDNQQTEPTPPDPRQVWGAGPCSTSAFITNPIFPYSIAAVRPQDARQPDQRQLWGNPVHDQSHSRTGLHLVNVSVTSSIIKRGLA